MSGSNVASKENGACLVVQGLTEDGGLQFCKDIDSRAYIYICERCIHILHTYTSTFFIVILHIWTQSEWLRSNFLSLQNKRVTTFHSNIHVRQCC